MRDTSEVTNSQTFSTTNQVTNSSTMRDTSEVTNSQTFSTTNQVTNSSTMRDTSEVTNSQTFSTTNQVTISSTMRDTSEVTSSQHFSTSAEVTRSQRFQTTGQDSSTMRGTPEVTSAWPFWDIHHTSKSSQRFQTTGQDSSTMRGTPEVTSAWPFWDITHTRSQLFQTTGQDSSTMRGTPEVTSAWPLWDIIYTRKLEDSYTPTTFTYSQEDSQTVTTKATNVTESPTPVVIIKPETEVFSGETVTFICEIQKGKDTEWSYDWIRDYYTFYPYHTTQEFSISSITDSYQGNYTCSGRRHSDSQITEMSDPVTLTVSKKPKPTVSVNPQSSIYTGDTVTLNCNLQSTGWSFFWYKYQKFNPLNTNPLSVIISNEGQTTYYCKALRGNYESEFSAPVIITVKARPKPVVKIQPAVNVFIGETVTLTCDIQTVGSWKYHWYRNNEEISDAAEERAYMISDVKASDKGAYRCEGTQSSDPKYTQSSDAVTLTVSEKPEPELTSDLKGAALTGNSVTLYCTLKLQSAGWKFYWSKDTQSRETETKTHSYTIRSVSVSDGSQYRCRAGRGNPVYYTNYSDALWVNVIENPKPVVIMKPDTQVFRGETVTFRCEIQRGRDTEWRYDWYKDDNTLNPKQTTQEFSISSVPDSSRGKYTCRGRRHSDNQISEMSDRVTLTVSEKPKPTVSVNPQSSIYTGDTVTLNCNLQTPGWSFSWYINQKLNSPNTNPLSVIISNEGQTTYYCKALRGNYESEFSAEARIIVKARPKPVVKIQPAVNVFIGETVTLTCDIQTGGSWKYHWYRNNDEILDAAGTRTYRISNVKDSNKGAYRCKGTQSSDPKYTQSSDAVTLTVSEKPEPELTLDLKGAALTGNPVILSCTLKLQSAGWKFYWMKDTQSRETETETHSYTIRSVSVPDGGQYRCRAGRGKPVYYTHYSDALWVNVIGESSPVSLFINPSRSQHFTADSLSLSCEDQRDSTGWKVRGYTHNEASIISSSVSGSTYNIISLSPSHTGVYWCQSESGERSDSVNITVHNGDVILDSPVHPVTEGCSLTLRCLYRKTTAGMGFYKDDSVLQSKTTLDMTISSVSTSDEGFYHCKNPERGDSPKSWISVRVQPPGKPSVLKILSSLVVVSLYVLVTIILAVKCYRARTEPGEDIRPYRVIEGDTSV
ncbi:Fc receptor-like protein 5 [Silurus meridionalis]|uniref:Fc receptor-like protein 5 n=1 Tax=Silurus meridionalis TaxID=175797 RepID=UPI001EE9E8F9|nr:Fc receptor-like protein 5 [Silurus meridionalis]